MIFLSKWVICRFHVNLPGCNSQKCERLNGSLKKMTSQILVPTLFVLCSSFSKVILCNPPVQFHDEMIFTCSNMCFCCFWDYASIFGSYMCIYIFIFTCYIYMFTFTYVFYLYIYIWLNLYIHIVDTLSIELKSIEHWVHLIGTALQSFCWHAPLHLKWWVSAGMFFTNGVRWNLKGRRQVGN